MSERKKRGQRLGDARKRKGLTQREVAAIVLPPGDDDKEPRFQTVSEWETGKRDLTVSELTALRELYGFGWEWYFTGVEADTSDAFWSMAEIVDRVRATSSPSDEWEDRFGDARPDVDRTTPGDGTETQEDGPDTKQA